MINIFHHSQAFIEKHKHHHHLFFAVLALIVVGTGVYTYRQEIVQAATYTFTQSSWAGGVDTATTATHTSNQTGWTKYYSATGLTAESDLRLTVTNSSMIDDGVSTVFATVADYPYAITIDTSGNLYTANYTGGSNIVNKITSSGTVTTFATVGGQPSALAFDSSGNLYVANKTSSTVSKVTSVGTVTTFASVGSYPVALAFDSAGNLYTANLNSNTVSKVTPSGTATTFATVGLSPSALAFDSSGNLYVANSDDGNISKVTSDGTVTTFATIGAGLSALAFDTSGNLYVARSGAGLIYKITPAGSVSNFATVGVSPVAIIFDTFGNLYTANSGASSVNKITPSGTVTTLASVGSGPVGIVLDTTGSLYTANSGASTISKVLTHGGFEGGAFSNATVSGSGTSASIVLSGAANTWSSMASVPETIDAYGALAGVGDYVYGFRGSMTTPFYRYSVSGNSWTTMAAAPAGVRNGAALVYPGSGDYIYGTTGVTNNFARYSISGNSWTSLTAPPSWAGDGGALVYPGSGDYIYGYAGYNSTTFYRYSISGDSWTTMAATPDLIYDGGALVYPGSGDYIYGYQGDPSYSFYRYSISGNSWTTMAPVPNRISAGGALVSPGSGDYIYGFQGNYTSSFYRYSISGDSWTTMASAGYAIQGGAALAYPGTGAFFYGYVGGYTNYFLRYAISNSYSTSGTFTSPSIDTGAASAFTTLSWTATLNSQTITIKARSSATADFSSATAWGSCSNITSGANLSTGGCVTNGHRYIQYQATLSTSNSAVTPTLDSVTINYSQYGTSGSLVSSKYDTGDAANLISKITWTGSGTTTTETLKFQVRSSADGTTWSNWCGPSTTCDGTDYFLDANNGASLNSGHPLRNGGDDRYLQYQAFYTSGGAGTPILNSVVATYVVNAAPSFDASYGTNGVVVSQNTDTSSADFGKVTISYKIKDVDTTTGTTNPGYITPSFAYNVGAGWVDITTNLATGDTSNKAVEENAYNTYTATWEASSTVTTFSSSAQIRVTVNDNEAANNTGTATSAAFTLDTTPPTVTATLNSSGTQDVVTLTATDSSTLTYRLCSVADFTGCSTWSSITSGVATPINFTATGAPNAETVYLQVRDLYGNVNTSPTSVTAPATPTSLLVADVSNPGANTFGETLSWVAPANAVSYKVYEAHTASASTLPSSYTLLASPSTNVYAHTITTATTSAYWYRVSAVNTNGDISNFTTEQTQGDVPDSFGTTLPDTTAPTIVSSAVPTIRNNSANITFVTNELAVGQVYYGVGSCSTATTMTTTYSTSTSVWLTGLTPLQTYTYCFRATDTLGNQSSVIAGSTFTTVGGPVISNVTEREITDTSALIFWNTTASSTSYVQYATTASGVSAGTQVGSATLVSESPTSGVYQHQVGITGLTSGVTYYYQVTSADSIGNTTVDTNNGQYYSFVTLRDTSPPTISGIATPVISSNAVVVVWQTDEPATSQVLYDTVATGRSKYLAADTTKSIYHVATLSSATTNSGTAGGTNELSPTTAYYYVVKSVDAAGNTVTSDEQTVTTTASGNVTIVAVSVSSSSGTTADTIAPKVSNVKVSDLSPFGATVSFETDEDTDAFVEYGKSATYGDTAGDKSFSKTHTVKVRGLTMGTEYHIKVTANDKGGNTGTSGDQTFKTTFLSENLIEMTNVDNIEQFQKEIEDAIESILPSLVPPFVSKPTITDVTEGEATVSFKTNIKAFPVVVFAEDGLYNETKENPYNGEISDTGTKGTSHELKLTGLKGNTKYHIQARAFSLPKVIGKSADVTFTTKASKISGSIVERKKDSFTVVWTTEEPTSSIVEYKNVKTGITERKTDDAKKKSHSMKIENLPSGNTYEVNLSGVTEQGNIAEAGSALSVTTSRDVTAPVISGFKVDNALVPNRTDRIQTIVSWVTDEPSNASVYYEEGVGSGDETKELANKSEALDSYVMNHSVILPNLKPGTIYRLKVVSSDDSGNEGYFGPRTVITPRQTESITDIIFKNFEDSFKFLRKI